MPTPARAAADAVEFDTHRPQLPTERRPRISEVCARCGATFECGMTAGLERCWCADFPPIAPDRALAGCLCSRCLKEFSAQQAAAR